MANNVEHTGREFDKAYKTLFHYFWTDKRIPNQLKMLLKAVNPTNSLELGCGVGYFSEYMENQGVRATGIDFSSVAIEKAKKRTSKNERKPTFLVGDVTNLQSDDNQYDIIFDVGCFHCLDEENGRKYITEAHRVLKPNGILLMWALYESPMNIYINSEYIEKIFMDKFILEKTEFSRRRITASNWFWLKKK